MAKENFTCVTLSRLDFEKMGYATNHISDEQMEKIAHKIGDILVENLYWDCIETFGKELTKK